MKKKVALSGIRTRDLRFTAMAELDWLKSPGKREVPGSNPTEGNNMFFMSEKLLIFSTVQWYLKCEIHIFNGPQNTGFNQTFWSFGSESLIKLTNEFLRVNAKDFRQVLRKKVKRQPILVSFPVTISRDDHRVKLDLRAWFSYLQNRSILHV